FRRKGCVSNKLACYHLLVLIQGLFHCSVINLRFVVALSSNSFILSCRQLFVNNFFIYFFLTFLGKSRAEALSSQLVYSIKWMAFCQALFTKFFQLIL
ncbi:MAG: hypothetical protein IJS76_01200, partial [Pseudobutyrivibrio sp.]|nr:hypothetical protein [Pseudobutyrivibrio sp.]